MSSVCTVLSNTQCSVGFSSVRSRDDHVEVLIYCVVWLSNSRSWSRLLRLEKYGRVAAFTSL